MENTGEQWLIFLLAAAALHGVWLAVLLFLKNKQQPGGPFLGITFIIISLFLLNYLLFLTGAIRNMPHLLGVFYPAMFLVGPCYYFFVKRSLEPDFRFRKIHLLHLLPVVFFSLKTIPLYLAPADTKLKIIEWVLHPDDSFTWQDMLLGNDFIFHISAYVIAAVWLSNRMKNAGNSRWLYFFSLGMLAFLALDLVLKFTFFIFKTPAFTVEYVMASVMALGIHLTGYRTIGRLGQPEDLPAVSFETDETHEKYKTSPLTPGQMEACQDELLILMKNEKPFLDADLKISDLAARLDIPSHHLSQILNEGMDTNFYDFVNTYRVEEAKRRLKDEKFRHYSILAIGLECGFANKTTFNRTFKKLAGMTPSAFSGMSAAT